MIVVLLVFSDIQIANLANVHNRYLKTEFDAI